MRIFLFAQHYPIPYKPYYDAQFADLVEQGHDIRIFAAGALDTQLNEKVERHRLREKTSYYPSTLRFLPGCGPRILRTLLSGPVSSARRAKRAHAPGDTLKGRVLNGARALALGAEEPDVCLVHGLGTAVMFRWLRSAYPHSPVAMYYHGGEVPTVRALDDAMAEEAFQSVDLVFTNTEFSRQHAIDRGCPPDRVRILPVGFCLEDFPSPTGRRYRPDGKLRILSAGRMSEEKGFQYALEAIRTLVSRGVTELVYSLTGDGYIRPQLDAYVRENGLEEHVRFLGTLSTEGVVSAMAETDLLLLPSVQVGNWVENQACAVQEAMLLRALPIITRTGGVPESIPAVMSSFVVPPNDAAALADSIERAYRLDNVQFQALGDRCRAFVVEGYDIRTLNRRMLEAMVRSRYDERRPGSGSQGGRTMLQPL